MPQIPFSTDDCLDGLTEQQARRHLVRSTTTLGLVRHATFVEKVWFQEAVTCRSRDELDIPGGMSGIRRAVAASDLDEILRDNRRIVREQLLSRPSH